MVCRFKALRGGNPGRDPRGKKGGVGGSGERGLKTETQQRSLPDGYPYP